MLTERQLKLRKSGLGSSEIAAVCGENPHSTPHEVWLEKRGLSTFEGNLATWLGHELEPVLARRYTIETGIPLRRGRGTKRAKGHPFALATIDYEALPGSQNGAGRDVTGTIVECKHVGIRVSHHWEKGDEGVPAYVQIQAQWQMGVCERTHCDVAMLLGGLNEFRIYPIEFDPAMFASLLEIGRRFWEQNVLGGEPPATDATEACRLALIERYRLNRTPLDDAPDGFAELCEEREQWRLERKALEEKQAKRDNEIRRIIAEREGLRSEFGVVTHKENVNGVRGLRFYARKESKAA